MGWGGRLLSRSTEFFRFQYPSVSGQDGGTCVRVLLCDLCDLLVCLIYGYFILSQVHTNPRCACNPGSLRFIFDYVCVLSWGGTVGRCRWRPEVSDSVKWPYMVAER